MNPTNVVKGATSHAAASTSSTTIHFTLNWESLLRSVLASVAILIVALIVYYVFRSIINRIVRHNQKVRGVNPQRIDTLRTLLNSIIGYVIIFVAVVAVLGEFHVSTSAIVASAGIVGLAVGFGAQGLVSDVVTGLFMLLEGQVNVGEYVTTGNYSGIVEEFGMRVMKVRDFNGDLHYIPNRVIGPLTNHSRGTMRALVDMSISYDQNIDEAISVLQARCDKVREETPEIVDGPNVVGVQALGASDVVLRIIARTENNQQWAVQRKLTKELKDALDEAGIEIPYPHQTVIHKNGERC